jgi:hypothetical protein
MELFVATFCKIQIKKEMFLTIEKQNFQNLMNFVIVLEIFENFLISKNWEKKKNPYPHTRCESISTF